MEKSQPHNTQDIDPLKNKATEGFPKKVWNRLSDRSKLPRCLWFPPKRHLDLDREAIREIVSLYKEGLLKKPESYAYAYPDLLTFHDSPTTIENRLFTMHLKHRMRAFQGAFHMNPDYTLWYGWNEMVQDLREIQTMAAEMREKAKSG